MPIIDKAEWDTLTMPDLLALIGGIFGELHDDNGTSDAPDDDRLARARCLRRALGEVSERAAAVCPPFRLACSCGLEFATPDALDEHFYDVFLPSDDIGLDGKLHVEIRAE